MLKIFWNVNRFLFHQGQGHELHIVLVRIHTQEACARHKVRILSLSA